VDSNVGDPREFTSEDFRIRFYNGEPSDIGSDPKLAWGNVLGFFVVEFNLNGGYGIIFDSKFGVFGHQIKMVNWCLRVEDWYSKTSKVKGEGGRRLLLSDPSGLLLYHISVGIRDVERSPA